MTDRLHVFLEITDGVGGVYTSLPILSAIEKDAVRAWVWDGVKMRTEDLEVTDQPPTAACFARWAQRLDRLARGLGFDGVDLFCPHIRRVFLQGLAWAEMSGETIPDLALWKMEDAAEWFYSQTVLTAQERFGFSSPLCKRYTGKTLLELWKEFYIKETGEV